MRERRRDPPGGLFPEQHLRIVVPAQIGGAEGPGEPHGGGEGEGRADTHRPSAPLCVINPQRTEQRRRQREEKDDRPFREQAQAGANPVADERPPSAMPAGLPEGQLRADHRCGEQHVEHDREAEDDEHRQPGEHERACGRARRGIRRKPAVEQMGQQQGRAHGGRADEARGPNRKAEQRPACVDEPEQQRRLVRVGLEVERWQGPAAGGAHFPGDRQVARLVDRQRGP